MPKKSAISKSGHAGDDPVTKVYVAIERFVSEVPETGEQRSAAPAVRARKIANTASAKAALFSGGLALPPGPFGMLTILPDLFGIWKLQAKMVADIAGTFGMTAYLGREQMLYCLFKHAAAQLVRDLVVRVGERLLVRRVSLRIIQRIIRRISIHVTQRTIARTIAKWVPLAGAVGVGAYAFYDTAQVANTAITLFEDMRALAPRTRKTGRNRAKKRRNATSTTIVRKKTRQRQTRQPPRASGETH